MAGDDIGASEAGVAEGTATCAEFQSVIAEDCEGI